MYDIKQNNFFFLVITVQLLIPIVLYGQQVTFTALPKQNQLYPRDTYDSAAVTIAGNTSTSGFDSISVAVYKNNSAYKRISEKATYVAGSASFSFSVKIHAELSNYKFETRFGNTLVSAIDSVVCGDAYFVVGQSNAVTMASWNFNNPWIRSFGYEDNAIANGPVNYGPDTVWGKAQCVTNLGSGPGGGHLAIGVWEMQASRHIVENQHIPVCFINGAVGGTAISYHLRNTGTWSIYGAALYRITKAELINGLKAILWFQGEADGTAATMATQYKANLDSLYSSWKKDYRSVKRFYIFQKRAYNCAAAYSDIIAETERVFANSHADVSIMSTMAISGYDGCHYDTTGYKTIGDRIYPLLARDFYGSRDSVNICPADILNSWFGDAAHTRIVLQFNEPVVLPSDASIKNYISLDNMANVVDSIKSDTSSRTLTLFVHGHAGAMTVSYIGREADAGGVAHMGPWLTNPAGVGNLLFHDIPISSSSTIIAQSHSNGLQAGIHPFCMTAQSNSAKALYRRFTMYGHLKAVEIYSINGKLIRCIKPDQNGSMISEKELGRETVIIRVR